ncbi:hypothetical protein M514_09909 [Trichuris suis]|uniref:Uncharacterized protein n=1 Tax=Trichuris suis TaxID=68888 RepID=A0A085N4D7_9BILA|nr:hypothetical protein M514_09909 [Trichuris suis]
MADFLFQRTVGCNPNHLPTLSSLMIRPVRSVMLNSYAIAAVLLLRQLCFALKDYALPPLAKFDPFSPGSHPFPKRNGADMFPHFPLTHHFASGFERGSGGGYFLKANLNLPFPRWKAIWDIKGYIASGFNAPWYSYGHMVRPVNTMGLKPSEIMRMMLDPAVREARRLNLAPPVPVGRLPSGYDPVHCRPPICNPFMSTVGVAVQAQEDENYIIDGLLDFPVHLGRYGEALRFPLTGSGYFGRFPPLFVYGQHMNAVDPFPKLSKP